MKRLMGNHGRLFSRSLAAGLVLLLLAGLPGWQTGPTELSRIEYT